MSLRAPGIRFVCRSIVISESGAADEDTTRHLDQTLVATSVVEKLNLHTDTKLSRRSKKGTMQYFPNTRDIPPLLACVLVVEALDLGCARGSPSEQDGDALPPITSVSLDPVTDALPHATEGSMGELTSTASSIGSTAGASTMGPQGEAGSSEPSATETAASAGPEVPAPDDPPEPPPPPDRYGLGCTAVDILFVIDNSGSMHDEQEKLLASFSAFVTAIEGSLAGVGYHIGVVTSSWNMANPPDCQASGSLVTQTDAGGVCTPFADGHRFATENDDLSIKFPCMAQVGTQGSALERPVTNMILALDPAMNGPGGCNEGFLRDDAILVLVIITDDPPIDNNEDDAHPDTDTSGWHSALLAAKGGDPEALVVIGFVPWDDISCIYTHSGESPNLIHFVQSFGAQGVLASICEPTFGPIFADAVDTIVSTCENFPAPG